MRQPLTLNALRIFRGRQNNISPLWNKAEPISLEEIEQQLATLVSKLVIEKPAVPIDSVETAFEDLLAQLESLWEQLEDLDDCRVIL